MRPEPFSDPPERARSSIPSIRNRGCPRGRPWPCVAASRRNDGSPCPRSINGSRAVSGRVSRGRSGVGFAPLVQRLRVSGVTPAHLRQPPVRARFAVSQPIAGTRASRKPPPPRTGSGLARREAPPADRATDDPRTDRPRTVLVIGGTGSIGRHVVEERVRVGYHVRAPRCAAPGRARGLSADVQAVVGDITHLESLSEAVQGVDAVVFSHGSTATSRHGGRGLLLAWPRWPCCRRPVSGAGYTPW